MNQLAKTLRRKVRSRTGQTLFEYAVIIAAVAMVVILVLRGIGEYPPKAMAPVSDAMQ